MRPVASSEEPSLDPSFDASEAPASTAQGACAATRGSQGSTQTPSASGSATFEQMSPSSHSVA